MNAANPRRAAFFRALFTWDFFLESSRARATAKEDIKVGFVYIGDAADLGYTTYAHDQGTLVMMQNLGLSPEQVICKTNAGEDSSCEAAVRELVEQDRNVVFANTDQKLRRRHSRGDCRSGRKDSGRRVQHL